MKLQTFDSSQFHGKTFFGDNGSQNMFVYEPRFNTLELTLFFVGEGKFYPAKIFILKLKDYGRPLAFGLPQFFSEPNLVLKVF